MSEVKKLEMLFRTLREVNRLRIIKFIGDEQRSVSEIVEKTGLSQPLVSHHLRVLREVQILEAAREGPFIYYRLKNKRLLDALGVFDEIVCCVSNIETNNRMFCCPSWWSRHCKDF